MPRPKYPRENEDKNNYISRCVKYLMDKEGKSQKQALGQCYGMWREGKRKSITKEL